MNFIARRNAAQARKAAAAREARRMARMDEARATLAAHPDMDPAVAQAIAASAGL